jgi:hypothetical protein
LPAQAHPRLLAITGLALLLNAPRQLLQPGELILELPNLLKEPFPLGLVCLRFGSCGAGKDLR